jgi:DUF4097 and DUF4098 domain-containing protein YvlB
MTRVLRLLALVLWIGSPAVAAVFGRPEPFRQELVFEPTASLTLENPNGSISVIGTDSPGLVVEGARVISALDSDGIKEGQKQTLIEFAGDARSRIIRTHGAGGAPNQRWKSIVSYAIRLPRSANLTIVNHSGESLRVQNIAGEVYIRHVNGPIDLINVSGPLMIDTVNGQVKVQYPEAPRHDVRIVSINGPIEVSVPAKSSFTWLAQTLRGDIYSSLPLQGQFLSNAPGRAYQATVNRGGNPKIVTSAIMNRAYLLANGQPLSAAKTIRTEEQQRAGAPRPRAEIGSVLQMVTQRLLVRPPTARSFVLQLPRVEGNMDFSTNLGNIFVGELTGNARVFTRAGEIILGRVLGSCLTQSGGGSLNLGEINGPLNARTSAGDILVKAARKGGTVSTEAGNIQVLYAGGGLLTLFSGGGDVTVRQAASPIRAESRSGDISINVDPSGGSHPLDARSIGGNIILNLSPGFGANIEAVALTPVDGSSAVQSDFTDLEFSTEKIGNMVRTRAVGKINGGGEKIVLYVENGTIFLRSRVIPPATTR